MNETSMTSNSPDAESTETLLVEIRTEELPPKLLTGFVKKVSKLAEEAARDEKGVKRLAEISQLPEAKTLANKMEKSTRHVEGLVKQAKRHTETPGILAKMFADSLLEALQQAGFADKNSSNDKKQYFLTPRRLVVVLCDIRAELPTQQVSQHGPQVDACYDASGAPTKALIGFMHAVGATCENDLKEIVKKGKRYMEWKGQVAGRKLADDLAPMVEKALLNLSAPRLMRWGDNDFRFVRPVRGVLMMHGKNVIGGTVMNVVAGKTTKGHPILTTDEIAVASADDYEKTMREKGMIIIDEEARREEIKSQIWQTAKGKDRLVNFPATWREEMGDYYHLTALDDGRETDDALLNEVAAMCEYPTVYEGKMRGAESLPDFCVIGCMKKHQRFFPTYDKNGELNREHYFVVADNKPKNPALMLTGFDSVLHARLRDLSFYYAEDTKHFKDKTKLANYYLERLKTVTYHGKLGSQYERVCRLQKIADGVAELMNLNDEQKALLKESAKLCKADLPTLIIGEYPDMEGKMAAKYFCTGEVQKIVSRHNASLYEIEQYLHKMPPAYYALILADNLEKLVGMFGIDEKPAGRKDPHGLRLAAAKIMGVLYGEEHLTGDKLLQMTAAAFDELPYFDLREVWDFIIARMTTLGIYAFSNVENEGERQRQISAELQRAVWEEENFSLADIHNRRQAVCEFANLPEAETLIAAGKRINNIFRKSGVESNSFSAPDDGLFEDKAERVLHDSIIKLTADTTEQTNKGYYVEALKTLTHVAQPVDEFFDKVMVNAEDEKIRHNRFALLHELRMLLNCVVKLS